MFTAGQLELQNLPADMFFPSEWTLGRVYWLRFGSLFVFQSHKEF